MPIVQEDEFGPFIDLGHGGIRPVWPTRLAAGERVDERHFGGSTLHGVGKIDGARGAYRELWISAPEGRDAFERRQEQRPRSIAMDFEFSMASHLGDLAVIRRAAPEVDHSDGRVDVSRLKAARRKWTAGQGGLVALLDEPLRSELLAEGRRHAGEIRAAWEAAKIDGATPEAAPAPSSARPTLRM